MPTQSWIVYDQGKIGTLNQCLGLAEILHLNPEIKPVALRFPWKYMPPSLSLNCNPLKGMTAETQFGPPWPDLIIGGGRKSAALVAAIRKLSSGHTQVIQLLNPYLDPHHFDAVITPHHDQIQGNNVINTIGPLHRVTEECLKKEKETFARTLEPLPVPRAAVLIGEPNKYFKMDERVVRSLINDLKCLAFDQGWSFMITISRRTSREYHELLRKELKGLKVEIWDGEGPNPYLAYLAWATAVIVTCDSISMITEACFIGKPVYVYPLPGFSTKFQRFYKRMEEEKHIKFFKGSLEPFNVQKLDQRAHIAQCLGSLLK